MKEKRKFFSLIVALVLLCLEGTLSARLKRSNRILLRDIEVLTLKSGTMTTGHRSSPVPQLKCVSGGTAPCSAFRPRVVQCYNRGYDGNDIQWECKTDMDYKYRFGEIEVSCEGYRHRGDPYVLRGSCGLRYRLDYTKESHNKNRADNKETVIKPKTSDKNCSEGNSTDSFYGNSTNSNCGNSTKEHSSNNTLVTSAVSGLIVFAVLSLIIGVICKICCGSSQLAKQDAYSRMKDEYPPGVTHSSIKGSSNGTRTASGFGGTTSR